MVNIQRFKHKLQVFRRWQRKPHSVAPLSPNEYECATCGTRFRGNFCPRCGQSARVSRYSFKSMFLLFIDVWGLGNQGMVHSVRDLILRPGYMIRDYLRGMQRAYFPPFKMLFLITALSLIIDSGLNLRHHNYLKDLENTTLAIDMGKDSNTSTGETSTNENDIDNKLESAFTQSWKSINNKITNNPSLSEIIFLFLLAGPWYLFLRNGPSYPGMRFSEFFVATVYSSNMISLWGLVLSFLGAGTFLKSIISLLVVIPMRQLTGYSWTRVIFSLIFATTLIFAAISLLTAIFIAIYAYKIA